MNLSILPSNLKWKWILIVFFIFLCPIVHLLLPIKIHLTQFWKSASNLFFCFQNHLKTIFNFSKVLINTNSRFLRSYNPKSVLKSFHKREAIRILANDQMGKLKPTTLAFKTFAFDNCNKLSRTKPNSNNFHCISTKLAGSSKIRMGMKMKWLKWEIIII